MPPAGGPFKGAAGLLQAMVDQRRESTACSGVPDGRAGIQDSLDHLRKPPHSISHIWISSMPHQRVAHLPVASHGGMVNRGSPFLRIVRDTASAALRWRRATDRVAPKRQLRPDPSSLRPTHANTAFLKGIPRCTEPWLHGLAAQP